MELLISILAFLVLIICFSWYSTVKNLKQQSKKNIDSLNDKLDVLRAEVKNTSMKNKELLDKYSPIIQAENYIKDLLEEAELKAETIKQNAMNLANDIETEAATTRETLKGYKAEGKQKLKEAKEKLDVLKLDAVERQKYDRFQDSLHRAASLYQSTYVIGKMEGIEEGMEKGVEKGIEKGIEKGALITAKNMKNEGLSIETIAKVTGLSVDAIEKL